MEEEIKAILSLVAQPREDILILASHEKILCGFLISKLIKSGLDCKTIKWIYNWVGNLVQRIFIYGFSSTSGDISSWMHKKQSQVLFTLSVYDWDGEVEGTLDGIIISPENRINIPNYLERLDSFKYF